MYFWVLYLGYVQGEREWISCRQVSVITLSHHLRFARICSTLWAFEVNINVCVLVICNSLCMENSCISREIFRALGTKRTLALKKTPFFRDVKQMEGPAGRHVYHLLTILYTSCAQAQPVPPTQLVEAPYFLYVSWASGPDQHSPPSCTPNTKYPALFAACAHLWVALLSSLQTPSTSGMARMG